MGSDVLLLDRRAGAAAVAACFATRLLDGVAGERAAGPGGEQRPGGIAAELGEPGPQHLDGLGGERGGPVLAALAVAADVRPGAEVDVLAVQAGELGDPQAGLDGEQEQGVVAAAEPGGAVRGGEQRVDLVGGEVADDRPLAASGRDGQDLADHRGVLGCAAGRRSGTASGSRPGGRCGWRRCCPAGLPGAAGTRRSAVASRSATSSWLRRVAGALPGEAQQQPAGVAVGGDGVRAGLLLPDQLVGEEPLQDRGESVTAGPPSGCCSSRAAASASSSGTACRYQ